MNELLITRVSIVDQELLEAFKRLMPQLTNAPIPDAAELRSLLDSPSILVVARFAAQGTIIGAGTLAVFRTPSGLHAHIEDVVVDENLRGKGIGEALVKELLQIAREQGLKGVSLTCNPRREAANWLYQKMGFKKWETNLYWYELS
ncbi:MAG TPA: GNAT family N-acetyltransferase [Anaerolineales bacterium]|jgi:ribosomal protein S18 acetylase RimI-like enzyme